MMVIVGTRPEIIKMAPIIRAVEKDHDFNLIFVHSGQHYDFELSPEFIHELELPSPDINLRVGSSTHAEQTSQMLTMYENIMREHNPDVVLVEGDTNTVVAAGLAAVKLLIPLGHVEAGLRSYDRTMPEEINRQIVRVCAELHFAPTEKAAINLLHEGVTPNKIFITGNTIVDACLQHLKIANRKSTILKRLGLVGDNSVVTVTLHRPGNVDSKVNVKKIIRILSSLEDCKIIFPLHPRTRKKLNEFKLMNKLERVKNIIVLQPLGYVDFLKILSQSALVLTDSGGVQEEAAVLRIPCLTLRYNTERPETVEIGANQLVGLNQDLVLKYASNVLHNHEFSNKTHSIRNLYGDGHAGKRIVELTKLSWLNGLKVTSTSYLKAGSASYKLATVTSEQAGKTVREASHKEGALITLIYDEDGNPHFPHPETVLRKGWRIRMFGELHACSEPYTYGGTVIFKRRRIEKGEFKNEDFRRFGTPSEIIKLSLLSPRLEPR